MSVCRGVGASAFIFSAELRAIPSYTRHFEQNWAIEKRNGYDAAHPKDLALIILRDLHVLDADDLLVGKHALVLGWKMFPRFSCFLFIPVFSLRLSVTNCQCPDIEKR